MDCQGQFDQWCEKVTDPVLLEELNAMRVSKDASVIEDAFFQDLEFGTGGLRGMLGAGTNRMNIYTVGRATQGIANYIKEAVGESGSVAICFDSRINSRLFAQTAAGVLAANGIQAHLFSRLEPTPVLSFATRYLGCSIGINVTASHNPSAYNGYKVYGPDGCQITDTIADAITSAIKSVDIFEDVQTMDFEQAIDTGKVSYINEALLNSYLDAVYEQSLEPAEENGELRVVYTPLNGTGLECVNRILERIGVQDVYVVGQQAYPDGNFPTCPYPNPEIREALERGIALCEQVKPDLLLATDPDADRVGIAVKDGSEYQLLTGNETGALLFDYICRMRLEFHTMPANPVAVTTIVSTSIVDSIAAEYGVEMKRVLTGFKYIGGIQRELEQAGQLDRFIFGFEESYGYLAGSHARDKDAVVASMLICQMARYYRKRGKNLYQAMQDLYKQHGYHHNRTLSFTFEGAAGAQKIASIMKNFREQAPLDFAGLSVEKMLDYNQGIGTLPLANVVEFDLEGGAKVIVRPSGTEPKIKVYLFTTGASSKQAVALGDTLAQALSPSFQ
jgi:phosphoglucomutase